MCSFDVRSKGQPWPLPLGDRKNRKTLARANGTFRRASGWAREKVARSFGFNQATPYGGERAIKKSVWSPLLPENEGRRAAPVILCARGTPTMKLWSFDARSGGPLEAALPREE
jgi:hypothetical protein